MKQSWKISGTYANWRMIVVIEAPEGASRPDVPEWPTDKIAPVAGHFFQAVNYYEAVREMARDNAERRELD
ncbi:hypothetical protein [Amycolatopsis samaneae]|uniref:Uncharacterized protein n=1 Tax=Amycolatopsis samaneae TaxID=664691 RepID=A0ABW5GF28_9PSEU